MHEVLLWQPRVQEKWEAMDDSLRLGQQVQWKTLGFKSHLWRHLVVKGQKSPTLKTFHINIDSLHHLAY